MHLFSDRLKSMKLAMFCTISLLACGLLAAQDPFTLSVDVDMVLFNVSVTDSKGKTVAGLTEDNFRIFEDGKEQPIYSFQSEDSPATVGLVIDNSASMSRKRTSVVNAALAFLEASNRSDEIFIVNFNENVWMGLPPSMPFSSDTQQLKTSLMGTRAIGRTALYDAIRKGLQHLEQGRLQRKALVVLSDGGDTASRLDFDGTIDLIRKSTATVYAIGIYDPFARDKNPNVVKDIAKAGGGESFVPRSVSELPEIWVRIANGIRGQYTLGYFSSNPNRDGRFRKVRITAEDRNGKPLEVRTRDGYMAASPVLPR
jgi:Ca-activated chloride channel family protein